MTQATIEINGQVFTITCPIFISGENPDQQFIDALHQAKIKVPLTSEEEKAKRLEEFEEWENRRAQIQAKRFNKATKITQSEWDAPIFCPFDYGSRDGYFIDLDEYLEYLEDNELEKPEFVWGTTPKYFDISVDQILESATQEMYDDAMDDLCHIEQLQLAIDDFVRMNPLVTYNIDYKTVILLEK
ncbi:hypothetical protein ACQ4M3_19330 [Leptolyngbya sp. AN03gr2]|uniref:hypothetical protein n=1 Tax=Leptolyngbya sp. AN03gr2 TaxID=3423364 RepID=UPI003D31C6CF